MLVPVMEMFQDVHHNYHHYHDMDLAVQHAKQAFGKTVHFTREIRRHADIQIFSLSHGSALLVMRVRISIEIPVKQIQATLTSLANADLQALDKIGPVSHGQVLHHHELVHIQETRDQQLRLTRALRPAVTTQLREETSVSK